MNSLRAVALETLLLKLFNTSAYFNVSDLDTLLELGGITITKDERAMFRAFHCVNYCDMPKGTKERLATEVVAALRRAPDWKLEVKVLFQQAPVINSNVKGLIE